MKSMKLAKSTDQKKRLSETKPPTSSAYEYRLAFNEPS